MFLDPVFRLTMINILLSVIDNSMLPCFQKVLLFGVTYHTDLEYSWVSSHHYNWLFLLNSYDFWQFWGPKFFNKKGAVMDLFAKACELMLRGQRNSLMVFWSKFHDWLSCRVLPNHQKRMEVWDKSFRTKCIPETKYQIFHYRADLSTLQAMHNKGFQFEYYRVQLLIFWRRSYRPTWLSHHVGKCLLSKFINEILWYLCERSYAHGGIWVLK